MMKYQELLKELDTRLETGNVILAIDGGSASGKTTLSQMLSQIYDCAVFHMDDFFLRPEQRTPERYREVGGNVDRERFLDEVLIPLSKGETIRYRRFQCVSMTFADEEMIVPKKLNVIEGAYAMHPALSKYYNFSVALHISEELQKKRIDKRNAKEIAKRFFEEWIPMENRYFKETELYQRCDMCIKIG